MNDIWTPNCFFLQQQERSLVPSPNIMEKSGAPTVKQEVKPMLPRWWSKKKWQPAKWRMPRSDSMMWGQAKGVFLFSRRWAFVAFLLSLFNAFHFTGVAWHTWASLLLAWLWPKGRGGAQGGELLWVWLYPTLNCVWIHCKFSSKLYLVLNK